MAGDDLKTRVGNVKAMNPERKYVPVMTPSVSEGLQRQYGFRQNTTRYTEKTLKYGTDFYTAKVQGIDENDFYKWYETKLRLSQMVKHGTTTNIIEDWKEIKFESPRINAIGLGAKIECNGNTFIVSNPDESNGTQATAVCRRCNATWRRMDFYGNIIEEPFYWAKQQSQASANEYQDYMVIPNLYQKCVMQLNPQTKELQTNRRMILGSSAYAVRGLVDFLQSETGDRGSTHIMYFDLMIQEPIDGDDLEKQVADTKNFKITATLCGIPEETVPGQSFQADVTAVRNGQTLSVEDGVTYGTKPDGGKERLGEYPLTWTYRSSNTEVATVNAIGVVTTVSEGVSIITASLEENPEVMCFSQIIVSEQVESRMEWVRCVDEIGQYQSAVFECRRTEDGVITADAVTYTVTSGTENVNSFEWTQNGNSITVTGYYPDIITIRAECGGESAERTVRIMGF